MKREKYLEQRILLYEYLWVYEEELDKFSKFNYLSTLPFIQVVNILVENDCRIIKDNLALFKTVFGDKFFDTLNNYYENYVIRRNFDCGGGMGHNFIENYKWYRDFEEQYEEIKIENGKDVTPGYHVFMISKPNNQIKLFSSYESAEKYSNNFTTTTTTTEHIIEK